MATEEFVENIREELRKELQTQLERIQLAEREIVSIKAMEAPNLATMQVLTGTIHMKVVAIETQMETFGNFVEAEMLKIQDESKGKGKGKNWWKKEIMESKSVQEIGKLSDGKGYRKWLTEMKNLFDQARPGGRHMIAFLEMMKEEEIIAKLQDMDMGSTHTQKPSKPSTTKRWRRKNSKQSMRIRSTCSKQWTENCSLYCWTKQKVKHLTRSTPWFTGMGFGHLSSFMPGFPGQLKLASQTGSLP